MSNEEPIVIRALVADDDDVFLEILAETVEETGALVELASDGVIALEKLSSGEYDILISDLNMPRMDGLTLLTQVREAFPHILCILITGFGSLESAIQALRLGAYDYIQKPFMVEQVSVTVRNAVDRIRAYRERADLLREIEGLHKRICALEGRCEGGAKIYDRSGNPMRGPLLGKAAGYRPDAFLEKPHGNPNRTIAALDALKNLKRDGIISDSELDKIKQLIISKIESGIL